MSHRIATKLGKLCPRACCVVSNLLRPVRVSGWSQLESQRVYFEDKFAGIECSAAEQVSTLHAATALSRASAAEKQVEQVSKEAELKKLQEKVATVCSAAARSRTEGGREKGTEGVKEGENGGIQRGRKEGRDTGVKEEGRKGGEGREGRDRKREGGRHAGVKGGREEGREGGVLQPQLPHGSRSPATK